MILTEGDSHLLYDNWNSSWKLLTIQWTLLSSLSTISASKSGHNADALLHMIDRSVNDNIITGENQKDMSLIRIPDSYFI